MWTTLGAVSALLWLGVVALVVQALR